MSDKCPTCKGPVVATTAYIEPHETYSGDERFTYRSTAAEQLALLRADRKLLNDTLKKTTEACEQQLADKERELRQIITTDQLMATLFAYNDALDELTAANEVANLASTERRKLDKQLAAAEAVIHDAHEKLQQFDIDEAEGNGGNLDDLVGAQQLLRDWLDKLQGGE